MQITQFSQSELQEHLKNSKAFYNFFDTKAGKLIVFFTELGIFQASFVGSSKITSNYELAPIDPNKIILSGTEFQNKVWNAALQIQPGRTTSYQELSSNIGYHQSHRAVANALGQNKIIYFVPCHRIMRKNGNLGGYKFGLDKKIALLESEK